MLVFLVELLAYLLLTFCAYPMVVSSRSVIMPTIFWDPRNQFFNRSGCKNSKWEYPYLSVDIGSSMYITCPSVVITHNIYNEGDVPKSALYENLYICTKEEFDACKLGEDTVNTRSVMNCSEPSKSSELRYTLLSFKQFRTSKDDLAFSPGKTYYFIATSNGTKRSLGSRSKGRCESHNMKLAIKICDHGSNCHTKNNWTCETEENTVEITDAKPAVLPSHPPVNRSAVLGVDNKMVGDEDDPFTSRQVSTNDNAFCHDNICLVYMGIAGIIGIVIGVAVTILAFKMMRSRNYTPPSFKLMCYKRRSKQSLPLQQAV